jgi:primary-amine oxidase
MQFHPDGSIEARAAASGYVQAQWWMQGGEEDPFSHKIHNYTIGSLHEHQFLWKLDADILGRENAVFKKHYAKEDIVSPWGGVLPAPTMTMLKPVKTPITTEAEGSSTLDVDPADPAHFHIHPHPSQPNAWGLPRTYMLDIFTEMRSRT